MGTQIVKEIKLHSDRFRKLKTYGLQKLHVTLKLAFVGKKSHVFENKIKLMTELI